MKLNGKQSQKARALLKWNLYDLASRTRILHSRLASFEKGHYHLHQGENDELVKVFKKAGIEFGDNNEVRLILFNTKNDTGGASVSRESANIRIDSEYLLELQQPPHKSGETPTKKSPESKEETKPQDRPSTIPSAKPS